MNNKQMCDEEYNNKLNEVVKERNKLIKENKSLKEQYNNKSVDYNKSLLDISYYENLYNIEFKKRKKYKQKINKIINYIKNNRLYDVNENCINEILLDIIEDDIND